MSTASPLSSSSGRTSLPALVSVTTLLFAWGFVTSIIDTLVPMVRSVFSLSFTEAMLTQFAFFLAYGAVSLPAALLVGRVPLATGLLADRAGPNIAFLVPALCYAGIALFSVTGLLTRAGAGTSRRGALATAH
ncbi:hypothetical protein RQ831_09400 [Roseomonas gilardii]|uniref:Uncharacterized protein n=1 Tax=Roseomonas gilardii TaxID=257708 RepID=A0ABU3MEA2_9PROT|nr:hypothetical protein [Roseomonas gilardii]MDT8331268.1 hypothetical protein [Roseomonas gilardii]